jgi:F-type H+-transporting ATPase subunit b
LIRPVTAALALAVTLLALPVSAADEHGATHPATETESAKHPGHEGPAAHEGHAAHDGHHVPTFDDINWIYGILGEREGVEPSFLFRPKGMPAPFGIWIFDAALLYAFLFSKAKKPLREALKNRKTSILRGMDEAARMKREAEVRLRDYEDKLARIDEEVERVRREMREAAEAERARILAEARTRRERMEADAKALVAQELTAAADTLKSKMIAGAMSSALAAIKAKVGADDQQRFADEYLAGLGQSGGALRGRPS